VNENNPLFFHMKFEILYTLNKIMLDITMNFDILIILTFQNSPIICHHMKFY